MIKLNLKAEKPRCGEAPFDSMRKMMTTVHKTQDGIIQYTKGAPDILVNKCAYIMQGDEVVPLSREKKKEILLQNSKMASCALRVISFAFKNSNIIAIAATRKDVPNLSALKTSDKTGRWLIKLLPNSKRQKFFNQFK